MKRASTKVSKKMRKKVRSNFASDENYGKFIEACTADPIQHQFLKNVY